MRYWKWDIENEILKMRYWKWDIENERLKMRERECERIRDR